MSRPPPRLSDKPFDDLAARRDWLSARGAADRARPPVDEPGMAAIHAQGGRAPRRVAGTPADDPGARDNWRPIGPRNVGGRVHALAPDPGDPQRWYAGPAAGGVHRSDDGGRTWFALWHDQPSLAVGAIAVAPSGPTPHRVYVATGEPVTNGFAIRGHGIWVSDDGGRTWTNHGAGDPPAANPQHVRGFEAVAVDPGDRDHCWAAGGDGLFRTRDGGRTWLRLRPDDYWSDVVFSAAGVLYLVRAASDAGEAVVARLDDPANAADADLTQARHRSQVIAPGAPRHVPWPARGKLALAPSRQRLAYVRFVDAADRHLGVFRCDTAAPAQSADASAMTWDRLADHPDWFAEDGQGTYNLCIAVHPTEPATVATGMVYVYVTTDGRAAPGAVTWRRALHWALHDEGLREHHADNHVLVAPADGSLWVANDGGIARSENWADPSAVEVPATQPLPAGVYRWQKRDLGITAAQMYDCNQSPLVSSIVAAGMQDNGIHMTAGGLTWRTVFGADGGFVAFDPDDPYRFLVTWQNAIAAMAFPGHADATFPSEDPVVPVRGARVLHDGFLAVDGAAFVADTDRHALVSGRIVHTRRNRLYGTRPSSGERWHVEPVGRGIELRLDGREVVVAPTAGALRLGLPPGRHGPRIAGRRPGPFALQPNDELRLTIDGAPSTVRFRAADAADLGAATVAEVCARIESALGGSHAARPLLWRPPHGIELVTRRTGAAASIELGGTATAPQPDGLSLLGVNAGEYTGGPDRPASVTLTLAPPSTVGGVASIDLSGAPTRRLTVAVDGAAAVEIRIEAPAFPDPARVSFGQLLAALRTALAAQPVDVVASPVFKGAAVTATAANTSVVVAGTAADRLGLPPPGGFLLAAFPDEVARPGSRHLVTFDLHDPAAPLALTISDGATTTAPLQFTAARVADLHAVTPEELFALLTTHLAAHPAVQARADLLVAVAGDQASEVRFSRARPDEVWCGGEDGAVFRSRDDGRTWALVDGALTGVAGVPGARLSDLGRKVEALALHPREADTAYVGLFGSPTGPQDPGFLFRTRDGGATWTQVGVRRDGTPAGVVANGAPTPVLAIEVDPGRPDTVFAATPAGVFRSSDAGDTWSPFNEGLPNCPVTDLAFDALTGTLKAAAWGRGGYERQVGDSPPADVRVHVRATELDTGGPRPASAHPSVFATDPSPVPAASPDLKVTRRRPPGVGPDETVDGVVFDLDLPHDEIVAGEDAVVWVQIHNRGAFPARSSGAATPPSVRVIVLRSRAVDGPPNLPADFWAGLGTTATLTGAHGAWTVVFDRRLGRDLVGGVPAVLSETVTFPADAAGAPVGLLAVVLADDDPVEQTETDVVKLLATDRRVGYRETAVTAASLDRRLLLRATGPRGFQVDEPAGAGSLADRLVVADGDRRVSRRRLLAGEAPAATYDLGLPDSLAVAGDPVQIDVDFTDPDDFETPAAAARWEIAAVIDANLSRAGVPAGAEWIGADVVIDAHLGARVRVTGGAGQVRARLGLAVQPPAGAVTQLVAAGVTFNLDVTGTLDLEVRAQANHGFSVAFRPELFRTPTAATADEVVAVLSRAIDEQRLGQLAEAWTDSVVRVQGRAAATVDLAGAAVAPLGLARVDARTWRSPTGTVNAPTLGPLQVTVTPRVEVDPRAYPWIVDDPAAAHPADVRRMLNHALRVGRLAVRAEVPRVELRVGGSTPDPAGGRPVTGGAHLAELVRSEDPAAAGDQAARAALFRLPAAFEDDVLTVGTDNALYLRVVNRGNVDAVDAEHRLVLADVTVSPLTLTEIGAVTQTVPAEGSTVVRFVHRPGPGADQRFVVALSDQAGSARALPADLVDAAALARFARSPGAALRRFRAVTP